jgi:transcriptional regulator with XRE-family HTH domain
MERIRQLRKDRGLSQVRLAVMADMDPATLNRLERGTGNPNLKTLERVADALGVEVADFFPKVPRRSSLEPSLFNGLEDAAQSEASQKALAVLFQGLTRRGQTIVEQSLREGPSEALSKEVEEYYKEAGALHRIKGRWDIFGRDSDELAEAEAAYQEVEDRIQAMLRQDIDATDEERSTARRFKDNNKSHVGEEHEADAS